MDIEKQSMTYIFSGGGLEDILARIDAKWHLVFESDREDKKLLYNSSESKLRILHGKEILRELPASPMGVKRAIHVYNSITEAPDLSTVPKTSN